MSNFQPLSPLPSQPGGAPSAAGGSTSRRSEASGEGALAFKVLLDQLEQRTQALEIESRKDLSKEDLAGAVDNARTSLEQLLSLKDRLLEAYRA